MTALPPAITDNTVTMTWGPNHTYYGYCTIANVLFLFTNEANMQAKALPPSVVAEEISYTAINSLQPVLALYYEMPYVGTDDTVLSILREINAMFAAVQLIDRYQAANGTVSPAAALWQHRVTGIVTDIQNGLIRLGPPFGDAVPMSDLPTYPRASLVTVSPNPTLHPSQKAVFGMRRPRFRRGMAF